ncbi:hypothetical protein SAMN05421796_10666 [Chryseobacterium piscicola]|uniref:Uncharacterized protein n=1 Tax=Chryseobacterium piscicola TaxID=551459 RepID=A0A1N7MZR4_9FLAO|nr:hypothetical protein [Chryseobacterium piscicola]PQA93863.1 hypothetical protein B0A70_08745 [Chryseobacterium piscicola]SIS91596.1 hypothetical protein SAMN05421796_10666 [Chryseobacterium piscicola]
MKKLLFLILTLIVFSCKKKIDEKEQKIFDRITFIYNLKQDVDENTWKTFNNKEYDVPLIYFTNSSSYIANPTEKFLKTFKSEIIFQDQKIKIYSSKNRVDNLPFHMETGMTLGDPTDKYNYHSPFMMCSSYEETFKKIPSIGSTDEWITMVMHEYFHGYQYKHKSYIEYYEKEIVQIQPDSLVAIYKNNDWFKKSIDEENQLLLKALGEKDNISTKKIIKDFFSLRNKRRSEVFAKLNVDISKYEKCYETMEGTARYIEFSLYDLFSKKRPNPQLLKSDTSYKSLQKFRNYNINKDKWLYESEMTTYFYATGFNMARVLDKLKIDYKSRLFKEGKITMEDILLEKL